MSFPRVRGSFIGSPHACSPPNCNMAYLHLYSGIPRTFKLFSSYQAVILVHIDTIIALFHTLKFPPKFAPNTNSPEDMTLEHLTY